MKQLTDQSGQALVMVLVLISILTFLLTASAVIIGVNIIGTSAYTRSQQALFAAESGAEDASIQLLRNPNFTGSPLTINQAQVTVTVTSSGTTKTILSTAKIGSIIRKIQVTGTYTDTFTQTSWLEVP